MDKLHPSYPKITTNKNLFSLTLLLNTCYQEDIKPVSITYVKKLQTDAIVTTYNSYIIPLKPGLVNKKYKQNIISKKQ